MNDLSIQELKSEIQYSNKLLADANKEIEKLQSQAKFPGIRQQYKNYKNILVENHKLKKILQRNITDIREYKNQFDDIQKKLIQNKNIINALYQENQNLKMRKQPNPNKNIQGKKIRGASDLRQSFGFNLKKPEQKINPNLNQNQNVINEEDNEDNSPLSPEVKKIEFEKLLKQKTDSEQKFKHYHQKIISVSKELNAIKTYNVNYSNYINSINEQIRKFNQQTRVSVVGEAQFNFFNLMRDKIKVLTQGVEDTNFIIKQVSENIHSLKIKTLKKAENIIQNINIKFREINNNKKLNYYFLSIRMDSIVNSLDDLNKIVSVLQQNISSIHAQRNQIEKCINNLKINMQKFMQSYQEGKKQMNNAIRKTLRKTGVKIFNSINKSIKNEKDDDNDELYDKIDEDQEGEAEVDDDLLRGSTLIGINDFGKNIELFKSTILFQDKNIQEENRIREAKILRKNWHEICYVYDDYDMHDVNFEIKAVGLGPFSFFNSCSIGFYMGKDIQILNLEINGKRGKYTFDDYCLDMDITLKNLQTAKIYLKYKETPKFSRMTNSEKLKYPFFRQEYYGLSQALSGQMAKFSLILKGSFEIISFKDTFFMRNEQNKREKEYVWGGKVPPDGKRTLVKLSKNEATWRFNCNTQIISRRGELKNTTLKVPLGFVGGNNDIIKMNYSSPQTKNIVIDEENRIYEIKYYNSGYGTGDFILSGELKNRCKGDWDVDLTDEVIENHIPKEDKRDKQILEKIARKIIEDFDRNNKNTMFRFMDYVKIGKWVHNNIKYDLNYSGRTDMTAMDIYNQRVGVCHHMTRLSNALLYSLGYKVIYTNGFACEGGAEFDQNSGHAWSLIKVNGKWYPFDATWDILSGKLPVCHVFQGFFGKSLQVVGTDAAMFGKNNVDYGKFIG